MTRDNDNSQDISAQNEHQRGWEHIPSRDDDEIVSPISYFSPTSMARDPSQFQQRSEQEPQNPDDASATPRKGAQGPYEEEVFDAAPRFKRRRVLSEWWQEMLSAVSSACCLAAIVIILYKVNGKPLADWDEPVSLNAVVSVLSTAVKAGLILPVAECISQLKWIYLQGSKSHVEQLQVFDSASRGPAGSLRFFLQARGAPLVSYLACLIIILALALDPFTQQIIHYYQSFETPIPHLNSTVRHSQVYDRGLWYGTNFDSRQNDDGIMFGMMSGLYGKLPVPPFSCPGVNCTYPVVTSLGMCSTCEDVTERTVADCNIVKHDVFADSLSSCNYTLPGGSNITASETQTTFGMNFPTLNTSTSEEPNLYARLQKSYVNFTDIPRLYNLNVVRFDNLADYGNLALHKSTEWMETMTAHECVFELCVWSFTNWSTLDGVLQEGSVAQSKLKPRDEVMRTAAYNQLWPFVFKAADPDFPGNHTFEISVFDRRAILQTFYTMWDRATGSEAAKYFASSLYLADRDIPRTLDTMARGITYNMMSGPNSTLSRGQVFETQTFIRVRWEWLTLSIITVVGSVALLAATIMKTRAMHQRAWKSSLSPLLYADPTMVLAGGENDAGNWDKEDKVQRKAAIRTGLLPVSAVGDSSASSS